MALFSERQGYTKPSDIIIREQITPEIQNAILSCYDRFEEELSDSPYGYVYSGIENHIWTHFLNKRGGLYGSDMSVLCTYIDNKANEWYKKLDIIEYSIKCLYTCAESSNSQYLFQLVDKLVEQLNGRFAQLNFAYQIVDKEIIEITAKEEIETIEEALYDSKDNIKTHLSKALELYAQRPTGDYRNSIKESISAVEAISRNITEENVLNFKKLEEKGVIVPSVLRQAFEKLYGYTNDRSTGIRHALMDDANAPQAEEALFMLVSCSAFVNYLNKKIKQ